MRAKATLLVFLLSACAYSQSIYFLAATKTNNSEEIYPSSLYTRGPGKQLRLLRVVSPSAYYIQEFEGQLISVAYPNVVPTHVAVIHMDRPMLVDDVVINSKSRIVLDRLDSLGLAANGGPVEQFLGLTTGPEVTAAIDLEKVELSQTSAPSRVSAGSPQDYAHLYTMGMAGGPSNDFFLWGYRDGKNLLFRTGRFPTKGVFVDTLRGGFRSPENGAEIAILAANPTYLILGNYYPQGSRKNDPIADLFIKNRTDGTWKELQIPGGSSRMRLFGSWLAVIQQWPRHSPGIAGPPWDPLHVYPNPGRANERDSGSPNLPNLQAEYAFGVAKDSIIPGILELVNIQDGRRITIKTQQEDSEILSVSASGVVLFRVNDSILQAQIEGSALVKTTTTVTDKNVPEIHWAFVGPTITGPSSIR
jgi:hypothetical protein